MKAEQVKAVGQTLHDALLERGACQAAHGKDQAEKKVVACMAALAIGFAENIARIADVVEGGPSGHGHMALEQLAWSMGQAFERGRGAG